MWGLLLALSLCQGGCQTPPRGRGEGLTRLSRSRAAPFGVLGTSEGQPGLPTVSLHSWSPWEVGTPRPGCAGGALRGHTCHPAGDILLAAFSGSVYKQRAGGAAQGPWMMEKALPASLASPAPMENQESSPSCAGGWAAGSIPFLHLQQLHKAPLVTSSVQDAAAAWREGKAWNNVQAEIHRAHEAAAKLHYKWEPLGYSSDPSQQRRIF